MYNKLYKNGIPQELYEKSLFTEVWPENARLFNHDHFVALATSRFWRLGFVIPNVRLRLL